MAGLGNLGTLTAYLGLNIDRFASGLATAQNAMARAGAKMQAIGRNMTLKLTAPIAGAATAAIKLASDFQASMRKINTLVGLGTERLNGMSESVVSLSSETGRGATELADALFVITSAGQRGAEAMQILERSAKASAIGLGETRQVAKTVTAVLNAYGKENVSAARATDVLVGIVREGNLIAEELAPVLGRVVGLASQLGISFEEVGASIATFTRLGVDSAEAVTGLRGLMNSLLKPTGESATALKEVGLSITELKTKIKKEGLAKTLIELTTAFKGQEEKIADIVPNVRAMAALLGTAGVQAEGYTEIIEKLNADLDHTDRGFKQIAGDSGFQFEKTLQQLKNTAMELGQMLLPTFNKLLTGLRNALTAFQNLSKGTKTFILVVGGIAAAIGPAIYVLGTLATAIGALVSPIGLVVAGIVLLAAAITSIAVNWEALKERFSDLTWWRNALISMIQFLIEWNPFGLLIKSVNAVITKFGKDPIPNPFESLSDGLEVLKGKQKEYEHEFVGLGGIFDQVKQKIESFFSTISTGGGLLSQGAPEVDVPERLGMADFRSGGFTVLLEQARAGIAQAGVQLLAFNSAMYQSEQRMVGMGEVITGVLTSAFDGLGNAIIQGMENGQNALQSFLQYFINFAKGLLAKMISLIVTGLILSAVLSSIGLGVASGGDVVNKIKGGLSFGKTLGNILKGGLMPSGRSGTPGLASGGFVTGGGLFDVHKGETLALPAGSAVSPALSHRNRVPQKIIVHGKVYGKDIHFVNEEYSRSIDNSF